MEERIQRIWGGVLFYPISLVPQGCFRSDDRGVEELGKKEKSGWTVMNFPGKANFPVSRDPPFFPEVGD